jgi:hypothetical protein
MTRNKLAAIVLASLAGTASAAPLFYDGMSFGDTTGLWKDNVAATAAWATTSIRHTYEAGGLTHPGLNSVGGNYAYIYTGGSNSAASSSGFDPGFESASPGDTYWMTALAQWGGTGSEVKLQFNGANAVDHVGFRFATDGTVRLIGSNDGGTATELITGANAVAGQTHLLLMRATFGSGDSGTRNSALDFWLDPSDVSSEGALGTPDYTTGADSKFGRSGSYTGATITGGSASSSVIPRIDEVYFTKSFSDLALVPEPGSIGLVGIATVMLGRRRTR